MTTPHLHCVMSNCQNAVTHIGEKGYVYCTSCAADRQYWERCRRMKRWEVGLLERGSFVSYRPMTRAAFQAKYPDALIA